MEIHGTRREADKKHPVLDIRHWESQFPLSADDRRGGGWIESPGGLANIEQQRRVAKAHGELGPCVPCDLFVWAASTIHDKPGLTRIGGVPWREKSKPWPKGEDGIPLAFLGQICFADSHDILPFELPGEVALIFGTASSGWISIEPDHALEWSPRTLQEPIRLSQIPWCGLLPLELQGVIHRSVQYTGREESDRAFKAAGFKDGGWEIASVQATSIGTHADLPQGWPFEKGDGNTLVATLSSFYCKENWPLCDVAKPMTLITPEGAESSSAVSDGMTFGIGDAGCIWIYRDREGKFLLDSACG